MITVSSGAVPIYVGLLGIAGLKHRSTVTLILVTMPTLAFFSSILFFALALLPRPGFISVQIIDEIREARTEIISTRYLWIKIGFSAFGAGVLSAVVSVMTLMSSAN
jgi:hypothetical protein